jgi:calmodulin
VLICGSNIKMFEVLSEKDINELRDIFLRQDRNGDGCIATADLASVFNDLKYQINDDNLNEFITELDPDGYGTIDFSEFLLLFVRKFRSNDPEEDLIEAFKVYDRDGDGFINANEMMVVMNKLGEEVTFEEVKEIIEEIDTSGEGMVNYLDFLRVMTEKTN